jgi:single-strand DNA-binding protein
MNKIMLIGNLGREPEMSYTTAGKPVTKFSIAVNRNTRGPDGERKTETDWFNIVAWDNLAEICSKFLQKGHKVYVEGRLSQRKYTDRNNVERTAIDVIISDMEMLTPKGQGQNQGQSSSSSSDNFLDDDLGDLDSHPF